MEMGVILIVALIIFGPGKLPEVAGQVGKVIREFRESTGGLTGEFQNAMSEFQGVANEVRQSATEVQETTRSLTLLDAGMGPATKPARPLPSSATGISATGPATATKDDPLADLMIG